MGQAIPASSRRQLALQFRDRIRELHEKSAAIDERIRTALTEKLETTNAAAQLVYAAKKDLLADDFKTATAFLDHDALQSYLALGRKYQYEPPGPASDIETSLKTVRTALMLTGAIERPNGHGPQQYHRPSFFSEATNWIQATAAAFAKFCNRHPLSHWDLSEIDSLIATMQPALRIVRSLNAEIQRRKQ
jgi:hypothetical protein